MKRNNRLLFFVLTVICSCSQEDKTFTYSNSEDLAFNLITLCVDSTLRLDPGLNAATYLIDFSRAKDLNRRGIDRFLQTQGYVATETNVDSLVLHDSTWIRYQYFQRPVIVFDTIEIKKDGLLIIRTSKTKASDGAIRVEIQLRRHGKKYKCLSSEITSIS